MPCSYEPFPSIVSESLDRGCMQELPQHMQPAMLTTAKQATSLGMAPDMSWTLPFSWPPCMAGLETCGACMAPQQSTLYAFTLSSAGTILSGSAADLYSVSLRIAWLELGAWLRSEYFATARGLS